MEDGALLPIYVIGQWYGVLVLPRLAWSTSEISGLCAWPLAGSLFPFSLLFFLARHLWTMSQSSKTLALFTKH
jgi:hypothetical protein